ncbi:MAG: NDP-sugar synthase [Syntrophomonas sp.]|nr:NDP-sugar synthase [Syntrophomonas sp.]MDD3879822.1 NDP-sugar synthase [Syntrophomonas sp.]
MKAMIMAAGVGSRLMPLTKDTPKPMVPMANRPLMENIIELLSRHHFKEVIANLHHQGGFISSYFDDGHAFGLNLLYSPEEELLGTAGGVKKCEWFLDETFVVISGDALTDMNLSELLAQHRKRGALATIALKEVENVEQFGVVLTAEDGKISRFQEKPAREEALSHQANTGIYVFEPEIFKYIPAAQFYDFGRQLFPQLVEMGSPFYAVSVQDYWCDVGNIETYRQAHVDVLQGRVAMEPGGIVQEDNGQSRVLLGEGVELGDEVKFLGHVVIGRGCRIGSGTVIKDTVIWEQSDIGPGSILKDCTIGRQCQIGSGTIVNPGMVIGSRCKVPDYSILDSGPGL